MAITNSAGDGIRITTAAKNGTLGDQTGVPSTQIMFDTGIGTNNGNLEAGPTFVGRLVTVRQGAADEETRYITAITDTTSGTLNEAWDVPPIEGDTYHVAYRLADAETVGAQVNLNSKTGVYEFSRAFSIGTSGGGGAFAYFAIVDYLAMEMADGGSGDDFVIEDNGRFDMGYVQADAPIAGGVVTNTKNVDSEPYMLMNGGAIANINSPVMWSQVSTTTFTTTQDSTNDITIRNAFMLFTAYTAVLKDMTMNNITWQGDGTTNSTVEVHSGTNIDTMTLASTDGFQTLDDDFTETISLRNITFVGNTTMVRVFANKTWDFINPIWDPTTGSGDDILFLTDVSASVNEKYSFDVTYITPAGTEISGVSSYVYEGSASLGLPTDNRQVSSISGTVSSNILTRRFLSGAVNLTVEQSGSFVHKAFYYGRDPVVGALTVDSAVELQSAMTADSAISSSLSGTALSLGAGVELYRHSGSEGSGVDQDMVGINYDDALTVNSVFTVGEIVTGSLSLASGTVAEASTDAASGFLFLYNVSGTFVDNEALSGSAGGVATTELTGRDQRFTWEIDADGKSLQILYDYLAAEIAENEPRSIFEEVIIWGEGERGLIFESTTAGYATERNTNLSEGVFVRNRGAGNIAYLTANDGTTFTPPASVTLEVNGVVENAQCYIAATAGGPEAVGTQLMNEQADATGTATEPYNYTADQPVTVRARLKGYLPFETTATIDSGGLTITAVWIADPNFNLEGT